MHQSRKTGMAKIVICGLLSVTLSEGLASAGPDLNNPDIMMDLLRDTVPSSCRYTIDIHFEGAEASSHQRLQYDPNIETNWRLVALDGVATTPAQQARFDLPRGLHPEGTGPTDLLLSVSVKDTGQPKAGVNYTADVLPEGTINVGGTDISKHMQAVLTLDQKDSIHPLIATVTSKHPFRLKFFARVTEASEVRRYRFIDDQWIVPDRIDLVYTARLLGRNITEKETRYYSNVSCE